MSSHTPESDVIVNDSNNPHFQDILTQALAQPSRRALLRGGLGLAGLAVLPGCATVLSEVGPVAGTGPAKALGFPSVAKTLVDDVTLPPGYRYAVLHATGDALTPSVSP